MSRLFRHAVAAIVLTIAGTASAAEPMPPDPTADPMLITAGFLRYHPDLQYRLLGLDAYKRKSFDDAFRFFRRASFYADKPSQGMVAEMYWNGEGTPKNRVLAYAWMDLAAERGYQGFLGLREKYWADLTPDERAAALREGEAIYARFGDDAAKPRYEFQLRTGQRQMTGSRTGFNRGVQIEVPGPAGSQSIPGTKFYDERFWNAKKYWAWQDTMWMRPRIGKVRVGDLESVTTLPTSRVPDVAPVIDAPEPEAPPVPPPTP